MSASLAPVSLEALVALVHEGNPKNNWLERTRAILDGLFESGYPFAAHGKFQLRAPGAKSENDILCAAYIHSNNPNSGVYQGASFVILPVEGKPSLIAGDKSVRTRVTRTAKTFCRYWLTPTWRPQIASSSAGSTPAPSIRGG